MLILVVILQVVVGVVLVVPGFNHYRWIPLSVEVLEALETWSDTVEDQKF